MGKGALFVVILITAILVFLLTKTLLVGTKDTPPPGAAIDRAKAIQCLSNLKSVRGKVELHYLENNRYPYSLSELEGVTSKCPVTDQNYSYENTTGKVKCPAHPNY